MRVVCSHPLPRPLICVRACADYPGYKRPASELSSNRSFDPDAVAQRLPGPLMIEALRCLVCTMAVGQVCACVNMCACMPACLCACMSAIACTWGHHRGAAAGMCWCPAGSTPAQTAQRILCGSPMLQQCSQKESEGTILKLQKRAWVGMYQRLPALAGNDADGGMHGCACGRACGRG